MQVAAVTAPKADTSTHVSIKIPDPLSCLPPRARCSGGRYHYHPHYTATVSSQPGNLLTSDGSRSLIGIHAIEPKVHVTFRRKQSTFSYLSTKCGRTQNGESHWEFMTAIEKEVDPNCVDYQLHGLVVLFDGPKGPQRYTVDSVALTATGKVVAEETKASASYFAEPQYSALMTDVEKAFSTISVSFRKVHGNAMQSARRRRYNITQAFNDRFTAFDQRQLDRVLDRLAAKKAVPMAGIEEAIGGNRHTAKRIVNAMMCARHLAYDLDVLIDENTPVNSAPIAAKMLRDIRAIGL